MRRKRKAFLRGIKENLIEVFLFSLFHIILQRASYCTQMCCKFYDKQITLPHWTTYTYTHTMHSDWVKKVMLLTFAFQKDFLVLEIENIFLLLYSFKPEKKTLCNVCEFFMNFSRVLPWISYEDVCIYWAIARFIISCFVQMIKI
jgi:hypothetical protein